VVNVFLSVNVPDINKISNGNRVKINLKNKGKKEKKKIIHEYFKIVNLKKNWLHDIYYR